MRCLQIGAIMVGVLLLMTGIQSSRRDAAKNLRRDSEVRPDDAKVAGNMQELPKEVLEWIRTGKRILAIRWVMMHDDVGVSQAKSRVGSLERLLTADRQRMS